MKSSKVHVGEVIRNAVAFNLKNSVEEILNADSLSRSVERLLLELSGYLGPTDLAAVRDIVSEIQVRIERFRGKSGRGE